MATADATTFPDGIAERHAGRPRRLSRHANPVSFVILGALVVAALLGVFGGGAPRPVVADFPEARLSVITPRVLRNGIFFEARFGVKAKSDLADATIAISPSLWRDITVNTQIPAASEEEYADGAFRFHYGPLKAGEVLDMKIDGQINPPLFAGTRGWVSLYDGATRIGAVPITMKVLP